jgi:uncharacterized protein YkwD
VDGRPEGMTFASTFIMRGLFGFLLLALGTSAVSAQAQPHPPLAQVQRIVIEQTNRFRVSEGLPPVREAPLLDRVAQDFANFMARTDRYGHEADGRTPAERARAQGYDFCLVAENIAYEFSSEGFSAGELAQHFVHGWQNSPPHLANMLDAAVTEIGVAVAQSRETRRYYAVQMFGRTLAEAKRFQLANSSPASVSYRLDGERYSLPPRTTRTHSTCRPPRVEVQLPGRRGPVPLQPADGQRYVVAPDGRGGIELRGP